MSNNLKQDTAIVSKKGEFHSFLTSHKDFKIMADLGYVDTEFTMYGASYLGLDGEMKFIISSKRDEILRFTELCTYHNVCTSPVRSYTEVCPVPSGYEEDIAQQVKIRLGRKLNQDYEQPLFESLRDFARVDGNDAAYELLLQEQERIESLFDRDTLAIFEGLVDLAYQKKLLSQRSLNDLLKWISKIKRQLENDLIVSDLYKKNLHGYVYQAENGTLKYTVNAQHDSVYTAALKNLEQGYLTSPIFNKTYYYNIKYTLANARNDFKDLLKKLLDAEYMEKVKALSEMSSSINEHDFINFLKRYQEKNDENGVETINYYGKKWNIIV